MSPTRDLTVKTYLNPNINGKPLVDCRGCGKRKEHAAKGYCYPCYRRLVLKQRLITCKACGRLRPHKAFGLCGGCHIRLHHYDKTKEYNAKKYNNITLARVRQLTAECASCGFDKFVVVHHLDGDKNNIKETNLIGLCPNCHRMVHSYLYYQEIRDNLAKKGYDVSKVHPSNYVFRRDERKAGESKS